MNKKKKNSERRFWAKRTAFKLAAVLLGLVILVLGLEIFARLAGPDYHRFINRSDIYFSNPRDYHVPLGELDGEIAYGLPYKVSGHGFRLPEKRGKRPASDPLILGLGDSFTFGRGVWYKDIYLTRLEKTLADKGMEAGVANRAVSGVNLDVICRIYPMVASERKYPLVVYGMVLNDFGLPDKGRIKGQDFIDQNNGGYQYNKWRKRFALLNFILSRLEKKRLHDSTGKSYLQAFEGEWGRAGFSNLELLDRMVRQDGGELVVVLFPLFYDFDNYPFSDIHKKIRRFCEKKDIPFLDLLPAYSGYKAEDLWVHPIDHHPNEAAHAIAAKSLFEFLSKEHLLKQLQKALSEG